MTYDVRWMPRARRQAAEMQQWWIANRELAPSMFRDELARVISLLQEDPHLGIRVQGREIRRLLLPDTKHFLYYRVRRERNGSRSWPSGRRSPGQSTIAARSMSRHLRPELSRSR
jgi:plasmid stabilization system protein ParE